MGTTKNNNIMIGRNLHTIQISRSGDVVRICVSGQVEDNRKSQLYINEKRVAERLERVWANLKTKSAKLKGISVGFEEVDWYDSDCDMYDVPYVTIGRGLRKAKVGFDSTGTIPKEWDMNVSGKFQFGRTKKPFLTFINGVLDSHIDDKKQKEIEKGLGLVLGKSEKNYATIYFGEYDD